MFLIDANRASGKRTRFAGPHRRRHSLCTMSKQVYVEIPTMTKNYVSDGTSLWEINSTKESGMLAVEDQRQVDMFLPDSNTSSILRCYLMAVQ
jgi:hypothetical protein